MALTPAPMFWKLFEHILSCLAAAFSWHLPKHRHSQRVSRETLSFSSKNSTLSPALATIFLLVPGNGASEELRNLGQGQRMTASWVLLDRRTWGNEPLKKTACERSSLPHRVPCRIRPEHLPLPWELPPAPLWRGAGPLLQGRNLALWVAAHCSLGASWCTGTSCRTEFCSPGSVRESGPPGCDGIIIVMLTRTIAASGSSDHLMSGRLLVRHCTFMLRFNP